MVGVSTDYGTSLSIRQSPPKDLVNIEAPVSGGVFLGSVIAVLVPSKDSRNPLPRFRV